MTTVATKPAVAEVKDKAAIKQEVKNLAALIETAINVDVATGIATVPLDTYERLLPEGITKELVIELQNHNSLIASAATLALGNVAIPVMKKHKELERIELELPTFGKDNFGVSFDRSRQVPDRSPDNTGGVRTQNGTTRVAFNMYGTESRGDLKKVKTFLQESATAAFGAMAAK